MATRLERFLRKNKIKPSALARRSRYSRQHLLRIRLGEQEPTRRCIKAIARACTALSNRKVSATELFDLG